MERGIKKKTPPKIGIEESKAMPKLGDDESEVFDDQDSVWNPQDQSTQQTSSYHQSSIYNSGLGGAYSQGSGNENAHFGIDRM